jgi:Fe-S-cluster containining protein
MSWEYVKLRVGDKARFECLRCGRCCIGPNVGLTAFDIHRILRFLGLGWTRVKGRYVVAVVADMMAIPVLKDKGGRCVFLEFKGEKPTCTIYPARPMRCRLYPFIPYSPSDNRTVYLDKHCSGLNAHTYAEPPWETLKKYCSEAKQHYSKLYKLIFREGCEPLEALEKVIGDVDELVIKQPHVQDNLYFKQASRSYAHSKRKGA